MKFCNNCGTKILDNPKFCNKCGVKIQNSTVNNIKEENKTFSKSEVIDIPKEVIAPSKEIIHGTKEFISLAKAVAAPIDKVMDNTMKISGIHQTNSIIDKNIDCSSDETYTLDTNKPKKKSNTKYIIIISVVILIMVFISSIVFFSKDSILYNHYYNTATKETAVSRKLTAFNKALKYEYNQEVIDGLFETFKNDSYFIDEFEKVTNLNKEDKDKLIYKICTFKCDESFNKGDYMTSNTYLELAVKNGYDVKNYRNYNELIKKINETKSNISGEAPKDNYTFENKNPLELESDIYKYSGDYIEYSSNSNYLTEKDLSSYNKGSLALIRNEIFARHGYVFKEEPFKTYFNSKSWYNPNSSFKGDVSKLNKYELENINLIKKLENS